MALSTPLHGFAMKKVGVNQDTPKLTPAGTNRSSKDVMRGSQGGEDTVLVSDPQHENIGGRQKHTLYLVEQFGKDASSVRRRYSDFQWLYSKLLDEIPGAIVPLIPHKQAVRDSVRFSNELVDERCEQLDLFLKRVVSHPELKESMNLKVFLTAFSDEWEAARNRKEDDTSKSSSDQPQGPIGAFFKKAKARVMMATGTELETTPDDSTFEALEAYITLMDTHVKSMAKDSMTTSKMTKDHGGILTNVTNSMLKLGEQRFPTAYNDDLSYLFSELSEELGPIAHVTVKYQAQEEKVWTEPLQDLSREVQAAKIALEKRKDLLFDYSRKTALHKTKKTSFEKGKATQDEVEDVKMEAQDLWRSVEDVSKRVKREMESFRDVFEEKLRSLMAAYAKLQTEYLAELMKGWKSVLPVAANKGVLGAAGSSPAKPTAPTTPVGEDGEDADSKPSAPPAEAFAGTEGEATEITDDDNEDGAGALKDSEPKVEAV
uniref:PX domain-containing protein n=1 Tax=Grammatophora oceanica TaxID=210454 RepID=A0A7S1Y6C5_9STRA|mmetsp:Transcript_24784/g.36346  ORF Transcript_24784/g.36346 Transcript_24784/m.36346 type:complete len:488 (+) Transcript_24784:89-1552(+)